MIKGIIEIGLNDIINKDIMLYKSKEEIDVYINKEKIKKEMIVKKRKSINLKKKENMNLN